MIMLGPRRRIVTILLLWIVAIGSIVMHGLLWQQVRAEQLVVLQGRGGQLRFPADWWRIGACVGPVGLVAVALFLQFRWRGGWAKTLGLVGMILSVPGLFLAFFVGSVSGPNRLDSVRLQSGETYVLALEPMLTDSVYKLYRTTGPFGAWWGEVPVPVDYSEDGRFIGDEHLVVSADGKWLLVSRASVWTDCFHLVRGRPVACKLTIIPSWTQENYAADMLMRSTEIRAMTGLEPPSVTN